MKRSKKHSNQRGKGFTNKLRKNTNLENVEDQLYDYAYGKKGTENTKIAYNKLYAKNLTQTDKPLHSELVPTKPKTKKTNEYQRKVHFSRSIVRTQRAPKNPPPKQKRPTPFIK